MAITNFNQTFYSNATVNIPATASNIVITVAGAVGGSGGADTNGSGGSGGNGRIGVFTLPSYTARTLTVQPGGSGNPGPTCLDRNTSRSVGSIQGGGGGPANGCSGSGGGGGSGSGVFDSLANGYIIVAGGGGGGGGGSWNRNGANGLTAGSWVVLGTIGGGDDGGGATCDDGAGGGGGGGGAPGGAGGIGGCDNSTGGSAGSGGGSGYLNAYATLTSGTTTNNGVGYITVSYTSIVPQITSFSYSPNPQTSGADGIPRKTVNLAWQTVDALSVQIDQNVGNVTSNGVSAGNKTVDTGLQSIAGSNSPATRTYTLSAINGNNVATSSVTVEVFNDNEPTNFIVPSLFDVEPNIEYVISIGQIDGLDMITSVSAGPDSVQVSKNSINYSNSIFISNGDSLWVKATSLPLNTDQNGAPNVKELYVDVGPVRRYFYLTTREPDIEETFDMGDNKSSWPYPKIDITAATVNPYTVSPTTLTVDDIELATPYGTELTVTESEAQVRVKTSGTSTFGSWVYTRQYSRPTYPFGSIQQRTQISTNPTPTQLNTRLRGVITTKNTVA